jgi:thiamine pyrophosphate-dependent acetolactate synthase large subunit-like protein
MPNSILLKCYFWRIRNDGICIPAAIVLKNGYARQEVVAVIGDGGFQMTIQN